MTIEFDPAKARSNLRKHGVSFAHAEQVLRDPAAITTDAERRNEMRYSRDQVMQTAKQQAESVLRHLPDNCTLEDIQYHLYVLEKIRKGREDIEEGRSFTADEAKERLAAWLAN